MTDMAPVKGEWPLWMREFSERNQGRTAAVEVDAAGFGARLEACGLTFRGASYDPHDDRLEIMLSGTGMEHLTHTVFRPARLDLRLGPAPGADSLRVGCDGGETRVLFAPGAVPAGG